MREQPRLPLTVAVCRAVVDWASQLVSRTQRADWRDEWRAEIWHSWQFLAHADAWTAAEKLRLLRRCLGALPDACFRLTDRIAAESSFGERLRSPWTSLGVLLGILLVLAALTGGFPATRSLFQTSADPSSNGLMFIWLHPSAGGGDQGLPPDLPPAWAARSTLLEGAAPFVIAHRELRTASGVTLKPLVISTQASLFDVLRAKPLVGRIPSRRGVVITYSLWRALLKRGDPAKATSVRIGGRWLPVSAVLPRTFSFLSRQRAAFLIEPEVPDARVMVVARAKPGVSQTSLDKELTRIAETACYYFLRSQLRYSYVQDAVWIPVKSFVVAAAASVFLLIAVYGFSLRRLRASLHAQASKNLAKRTLFFSAKLALAFLIVFVAVLEWSRSETAVLYASRDPAAGPFLLWLYVLGTMGALFWAATDGRARCRVCLRLLCLPVRVGCPGCLLLDWSGTELLCTEGHGVLHVPHLTSSWDEQSNRWIALDESWKDLFAETK